MNTTNDVIETEGKITLREALLLEKRVLGVGEFLPADLVQIQGGDPGMGNGTDLVHFDSSVFASPQTISLGNFALPEIDHNVNIVGPGSSLLTIDAHGASGIFQSIPASVPGHRPTLANGHALANGGAALTTKAARCR